MGITGTCGGIAIPFTRGTCILSAGPPPFSLLRGGYGDCSLRKRLSEVRGMFLGLLCVSLE